jgi:hypothetical protein
MNSITSISERIIQLYLHIHLQVLLLLERKNMDIHEHERLFNLDSNLSQGIALLLLSYNLQSL